MHQVKIFIVLLEISKEKTLSYVLYFFKAVMLLGLVLIPIILLPFKMCKLKNSTL